MKTMGIRAFLLALLLAGMVMVLTVSAVEEAAHQLPEPPQVQIDEKTLKEMQKEIIKEFQDSPVIDKEEKKRLIKQLKEIWSGKSSLSEAEQQQVLFRVGEILVGSDSSLPSVEWLGTCNTGSSYPHNDMARVAGEKMGLFSPYVKYLYDNAGTPDCLFYSADHYATTGAPGNVENLAIQARNFLRNGDIYNGYRYLAYSIHYMSDMSMPFHWFPIWGQQHQAYEYTISNNWVSGQYYIDDINKVPRYWYYYITDPSESALNLARYSNQYQSYIVSAMSKPGWPNDPTLVRYTRDCFYQGELYNMGLINYVTRP